MTIAQKLEKILHPGVKPDGSMVYHEGALENDPHIKPGPSNEISGSKYGAAEGVDTRANQFEHDMKAELNQNPETRTGLHTDWSAPDGGYIGEGVDTRTNHFEQEVTKSTHNDPDARRASEALVGEARRASVAAKEGTGNSRKGSNAGEGSGSRKGSFAGLFSHSRKGSGADKAADKAHHDAAHGSHGKRASGQEWTGQNWGTPAGGATGEGIDTRTNAFEKDVKHEMASGSTGGAGAVGGTAPAGGFRNTVGGSSSAVGGTTSAVGGTTSAVGGTTGAAGGTSSAIGETGTVGGVHVTDADQISPVAAKETSHIDGHSDPARRTSGPHKSHIANLLDPATHHVGLVD